MSLTRKSDVKNHLSTRTGDSAVPVYPVSQPDATGYSGEESENAVGPGAVAGDPSATPASDRLAAGATARAGTKPEGPAR